MKAFIFLFQIISAEIILVCKRTNENTTGYYACENTEDIQNLYREVVYPYSWPTVIITSLKADFPKDYLACLDKNDQDCSLSFVSKKLAQIYPGKDIIALHVPSTVLALALISHQISVNPIKYDEFYLKYDIDELAKDIFTRGLDFNQTSTEIYNAYNHLNCSLDYISLNIQSAKVLLLEAFKDEIFSVENLELLLFKTFDWNRVVDIFIEKTNLANYCPRCTYFKLQKIVLGYSDGDLIKTLLSAEQAADTNNEFFLFRGSGSLDFHGQQIIDLPVVQFSKKKTELESKSLSYSMNLLDGSIFDCGESGARAIDYMRKSTGYYLKLSQKDYLMSIREKIAIIKLPEEKIMDWSRFLSHLLFVSPLTLVARVNGHGELFHSRTRFVPSIQDVPAYCSSGLVGFFSGSIIHGDKHIGLLYHLGSSSEILTYHLSHMLTTHGFPIKQYKYESSLFTNLKTLIEKEPASYVIQKYFSSFSFLGPSWPRFLAKTTDFELKSEFIRVGLESKKIAENKQFYFISFMSDISSKSLEEFQIESLTVSFKPDFEDSVYLSMTRTLSRFTLVLTLQSNSMGIDTFLRVSVLKNGSQESAFKNFYDFSIIATAEEIREIGDFIVESARLYGIAFSGFLLSCTNFSEIGFEFFITSLKNGKADFDSKNDHGTGSMRKIETEDANVYGPIKKTSAWSFKKGYTSKQKIFGFLCELDSEENASNFLVFSPSKQWVPEGKFEKKTLTTSQGFKLPFTFELHMINLFTNSTPIFVEDNPKKEFDTLVFKDDIVGVPVFLRIECWNKQRTQSIDNPRDFGNIVFHNKLFEKIIPLFNIQTDITIFAHARTNSTRMVVFGMYLISGARIE